MEKKKFNFSTTAEQAGKGMKNLLGKAKDGMVKVMDQNDDGSFDAEDVSAIAEMVGDAAKNTATQLMMSAEEKARERERKRLNPIFMEDLNSPDFYLTKLIRVTEMDKRYQESEVCQGAIGYITNTKDLTIINIFRQNVGLFGLNLYPDIESEVYYVDPIDRNRYIALEDYFDYLKVARINELQKLAQDLGAKHFKVIYTEHKATLTSNKGKFFAKGTGIGTSEIERDVAAIEVKHLEVAAEMECPGHEPYEPTLFYLQREQAIQSLIALRMDKTSPISHHKFSIKLSNSSGIKEKDAIKIDAALKGMKVTGNTTVTNEVQNESRRTFEYEVDF